MPKTHEPASARPARLSQSPGHSGEALLQRGLAALHAGQHKQAMVLFKAAVAAAPRNAQARLALARALAANGAAAEAIVHGLKALAIDPRDADAGRLVASLLSKRRLTGYRLEPAEARAVIAWLERADSDRQAFVSLAIDHLRGGPPFAAFFQAAAENGPEDAAARLLARSGRQALADPLLLAMLRGALNTDPVLEAILTAARTQMLMAQPALAMRPGMVAFAAALALQSAANEFVFAETEAEGRRVAELQAALASRADMSRNEEWPLLLYALYRPLDRLPAADALIAAKPRFGPEVRTLIAQTIEARQDEARRAATIPALLPEDDDDAVSALVREQYEANPYPRWTTMRLPRAGSWREGLARFASAGEIAALGPSPQVLIAGCGTGRQAITAASAYGPGASLLAVDLSRASLGYAAHRARQFGIETVHFAQGDLLRLPELGRQFGIVECVGVLHHLADMRAGLRALTDCLAPGGLLRLARYSRLARRDINAARAEIARLGLAAVPGDIRAFRSILLQSDAPWASAIRQTFRDVYSLSGCRDLLFHVQEHQLTIPEIAGLLAEARLEFRGFSLPADSLARIAGLTFESAAWRDLGRWESIEADHPDLFLGMYDFWVRKT